MTSMKLPDGASAKRSWTVFEWLLLVPFALLVWYIATEPLVVPVKNEATPRHAANVAHVPTHEPVPAADPEKQLAEQRTESNTSSDAIRVVFVASANTSLLQRIAPVASLDVEAEEPTMPAQPAPVATVSAEVPASPERSATPAATSSALRIAISDGTNVEGFAKDVADQLEQAGMAISTTDTIGGTQKRNVILFRDGFEDDAVRLSKLFVRPPALVNVTNTRKSSDTSDIRLVLGSAATREKALFASKVATPKS